MDDGDRSARYRQLQQDHPELFANPPDGAIEILLDPEQVVAAERATAEALVRAGLPAGWARTGVVFEDQYGIAIRDAVRMPGGRLGTYVRWMNPGNVSGVVVLPVIDGAVLMVRHFRHATRRWHLELPRGFGEPGSSPSDSALRELREETGAVPDRLVELGEVYPDSGMSGTSVWLYYAEVSGYGAHGADEGIESIVPLPPKELAEMIADGRITDGFTINAYARAMLAGFLPPPHPAPSS